MAVVFSKASGLVNDYWNEWADLIQMKMKDADNEKNNDDALVKALANVRTSKKFAEKIAGLSSFSNFEIADEGADAELDDFQETEPKVIYHYEFKKAFKLTKTVVEDGSVNWEAEKGAAYVRAYKRTRAAYLTAAMTSLKPTFDFGKKKGIDCSTADGKALFAKDHTGITGVAAQSNIFTNAFGNDDKVLTELAVYGQNLMNASGEHMGYVFDTLIVPANCAHLIEMGKKIINSDQQVGSNYNDVNINKGVWKLVVNHHWQAAAGTEPYIIMSSQACKDLRGTEFFDRTPLDTFQNVDTMSQNLITSARARLGVGFGDWRHVIYGGAAEGSTLGA